MRLFDTTVQKLKYEVLKALIRNKYEHNLRDIYHEIPKMISPGPQANLRCCVYKERAIVQERIKLALGGDASNPNVVEVIDIACDECPFSGVFVTQSCRGCIVHSCQTVCPRDAIKIIDRKAVIDKSKCIECGKCVDACQFSAIIEQKRPCVNSCKVKAISMDMTNNKAVIDNDKCIACGKCVYQCPFGAIVDKSYIMESIDILQNAEQNGHNVYAVVAPSIVTQLHTATLPQIVEALERLGFYKVVEAALGADIVLQNELNEWQQKGVLTTSCCPAFVMYIEKVFPELAKYISHNDSPMVQTAKLIKAMDKNAKVVFIGPCSAKKVEYKLEKTQGAVDSVISFEELQAFFDARDIEFAALEGKPISDASFFGRIFARSGGISEGLKKLAGEQGVDGLSAVAMNGIDECKANLLKLKMGKASENFFEGMACEGGCVNGALCLMRSQKKVCEVDKFALQSQTKIQDSMKKLEDSKL